MTMKHCMAILLALTLGFAASDACGQTAPGVQETSYANALALKDPVKRAEALEVFIAWYPGSHSSFMLESAVRDLLLEAFRRGRLVRTERAAAA